MLPEMKINKEWHLAHRMPAQATDEQRIQWHVEHLKHCRCRPDIPDSLKTLMKKKGIDVQNLLKSPLMNLPETTSSRRKKLNPVSPIKLKVGK